MANLSSKSFAVLIALLVSGITGIIVAIYIYLDVSKQWMLLFFLLPLLFLLTFLLVNFILTRFIAKKIQPIYQVINDFDDGQTSDIYAHDIIGEVNTEVMDWAITKTKEINQLKANERYRKEFLGNVSHELKTPVFNIQGYILTLMEGGLYDDDINMKYLKRTERNVERLITMVKDLETITQLEAGKLKLNYEDFNLVQLIKEVFEMQEMTAQQHKIKLFYDESSEEHIFVHADKKRIYELLTNLIVNSIKYNRADGHIIVSTRNKNGLVYVSISDSGIGMDEKHLSRIFERFYRVDKHRSREQGGSGLGLAIVKHIIEAHQQKITVKSTPNIGTTFTFSLKCTRWRNN